MKRLLCFLFTLQMLAVSVVASAQVTIKIEELSRPDALLPVRKVDKDVNTLSVNVDADRLVLQYGNHPFFYGMYEAYASHRPFVLSPDMIWLLISQGFSHHINADPEKYRDRMVDFQDKMSLVVVSENPLDKAQWDVLIPQFAEEIKENTKGTIAETMIADFSTTTQYEQIASEITLMETTKAYFEFVVVYIACGIPEVTLLGTTEDWQKVYDKAMQLRSFDLAWWIDELKPILKQFIKASEGNADIKFWRNMFKWHTQKEYGTTNVIDGWIVKFFPYDNYGKRFDLKTLTRDSSLPDEMAQADVRFIEINPDGTKVETMVELRGGFMGLEQNATNYALTPKIGWVVRKKVDVDRAVIAKMERSLRNEGELCLKVKEIPTALSKLDTISDLELQFSGRVHFPDWMKDKKIGELWVYGDISPEERAKLLQWYPMTKLHINQVEYIRKNGELEIRTYENDVDDALDGVDSVGLLWIDNHGLDVKIPKSATKRIGKIIIDCEPSRMCVKALRRQFPDTEIEFYY